MDAVWTLNLRFSIGNLMLGRSLGRCVDVVWTQGGRYGGRLLDVAWTLLGRCVDVV